MISVVVVIAWLVAAGPLLALAIYSMELTVGLKGERPETPSSEPVGTVAILIPAHNEAAGIFATVKRLQTVLPDGARVLVVADNCVDDTAAIARQAGAEVVERQSEEQRGKGYALAYGRSVLAADPPSVVIVVDADAIVQPGSVEALCRVAARGTPAQAVYLMVSDGPAPPMVQISNFAFLVKNMVRVRALGRIGRCALLTGSGMAFSWEVFAGAPLASGEITEDLNLGIALTRTFKAAKLVEQAVVLSEAAAFEASAQQRQRWEHGFLDNATRNALPLLWDGVRKGSRAMIALGLHLLVPPLALLMILSSAVLVVLLCVGLIWSVWAPAVSLFVLLAVAVGLTIAAWSRYGREMVSFKALAQVPLYVLWKLPLYARFLVKREKSWHRTKRTGES